MTAPDLLRCPFCGGEAHEGFDGAYRVMKCDRCPVEVYAESRKRLVKVWNTRATPAPAAMPPEVRAVEYERNLASALGVLADALAQVPDVVWLPDLSGKLDDALNAVDPASAANNLRALAALRAGG